MISIPEGTPVNVRGLPGIWCVVEDMGGPRLTVSQWQRREEPWSEVPLPDKIEVFTTQEVERERVIRAKENK